MGILFASLFFLFILGPLAIVAYVLLARWVWRKALSPLAIPEASVGQVARERRLLTYALVAQPLSFLGFAMMLIVYAIGASRHAKAVRGGITPENRVIPTFSIQDILTVVFSVGMFLAVLQSLSQNGKLEADHFPHLIMAAGIFPAVFICMIYRLNANNVLHGKWRVLMLFCSPYLVILCSVTAIAFMSSPFLAALLFVAVLENAYKPFAVAGGVVLAGLMMWYIVRRAAEYTRLSAVTPQTAPQPEIAFTQLVNRETR
jgi:hypothetical protein